MITVAVFRSRKELIQTYQALWRWQDKYIDVENVCNVVYKSSEISHKDS